MINLGAVPANSTLYIPFESDNSSGASVTITGLATSDIKIYKNGSTTERSSTAGFNLLDTDGIDFDSVTGIHGFSIDLSDNTDASFYAVGSWYWVVVSTITVDSQTKSFIAAVFRIVAAEAVAGKPKVDVDAWLGTAAATPTVAGVPEVDLTHAGGTAITAASGIPEVKVASIAANAITAAAIATDAIDDDALAADAVTAIQSGLATQTSVNTIDDFLDTEIAAIKAVTDQFVFTTANQVDARVLTNSDKTGYTLTADFRIKKNTALAKFPFVMFDSADHITGKTGLTVTAERSLDGGAYAAMTNAAVEVSAGSYYIDLAAADTNADTVIYKFTATGADATFISFATQTE